MSPVSETASALVGKHSPPFLARRTKSDSVLPVSSISPAKQSSNDNIDALKTARSSPQSTKESQTVMNLVVICKLIPVYCISILVFSKTKNKILYQFPQNLRRFQEESRVVHRHDTVKIFMSSTIWKTKQTRKRMSRKTREAHPIQLALNLWVKCALLQIRITLNIMCHYQFISCRVNAGILIISRIQMIRNYTILRRVEQSWIEIWKFY